MPASPPPLIGLTLTTDDDAGWHRARPAYARAVLAAGGAPVYLPITPDAAVLRRCLERLDGLVFTGGADIPPEAYGQAPRPETRPMTRERYEGERRLIDLWLETDKPALGICLGCQFVNVALGGTLVQNIPSQIPAAETHDAPGDAFHSVRIEPGSLLHRTLARESDTVRSSHHQAIDRPGRGLRPVAWAADGIIEALEMPGPAWRLLVQWHPERMDENPGHRQALFTRLVEAADGFQVLR